MGESFGKFLSGPIGSALRVLLAAVLGSLTTYLANGGKLGGLTFADVETWLGIGITVALPILIAALNRQDPRFGNVIETPVTPPTAD